MQPLSSGPMAIRTVGRFPHLHNFVVLCSTTDLSMLSTQ